MTDLRALLASLDPGGPDEGPPQWWLSQWRQEADELAAAAPAYAAHREQGRSPAAAAWEAELQMEAG